MTDKTPSANKTQKAVLEEGTLFEPQFDNDGLIPAFITDAKSGEALMVAWMNADALKQTVETGEAHFWSRSRNRIWKKGEESGNILRVAQIRTDCDQDALWIQVTITGAGAACHTGRRSCFYRAVREIPTPLSKAELQTVIDQRIFEPEEVYRQTKLKE